MSRSNGTRDHEEIRRWAEARGAVSSEVASTHNRNEPGILRFQFPGALGEKDGNLREISRDAFFDKFDENDLQLVYQEQTAEGARSNFNGLVHPDKPSSSGTARSSGEKTALREPSDDSDEDEFDEDEDDEDESDDSDEEE